VHGTSAKASPHSVLPLPIGHQQTTVPGDLRIELAVTLLRAPAAAPGRIAGEEHPKGLSSASRFSRKTDTMASLACPGCDVKHFLDQREMFRGERGDLSASKAHPSGNVSQLPALSRRSFYPS